MGEKYYQGDSSRDKLKLLSSPTGSNILLRTMSVDKEGYAIVLKRDKALELIKDLLEWAVKTEDEE